MKKLALILTVALSLSACGETVVYLTPDEAKKIEATREMERKALTDVITRQLPPGCEFRDLGDYKRQPQWGGFPILAIFCGKTVTTGTLYPVGKSRQVVMLTTDVQS